MGERLFLGIEGIDKNPAISVIVHIKLDLTNG